MVRFGICAGVETAAQAKAQGWDYVEGNAQSLFVGLTPDAEYHGREQISASPLPVAAANCLVPGALKIVGPAVDRPRLTRYLRNTLSRAGEAGTRVLVLGSGDARRVPDGFDCQTARAQLIEFAIEAAKIAAEYGVTIMLEPLNQKECNIVNSVAEAMEYVKAVNHPAFQCLVDSYHLWMENEPASHVAAAGKSIRHVHVADLDGRVAPGRTGQSDYRPLFSALKSAGYDGMISIEASGFDLTTHGAAALAFLKKQWTEAV